MSRLPELAVTKPCEESWEAMRGDARSRHCEACGKDVLNLAAMSRREVERVALRVAAGDAVCGRVTRRMDGELVTLPDAPAPRFAWIVQRTALGAAIATALPAMAQTAPQSPPQAASQSAPAEGEVSLPEVPPDPQPVPGKAVVIGRLLHPDGTRVQSGIVYAQSAEGGDPVYVLDSSGWFELHLKPGRYQFLVRTGKDQVERISAVDLHEGIQQFSDLRTRAGMDAPELEDLTYTTGGALASTISWRWGWHAFRHPVLYARYLVRKIS